jgi:hypothetical protein
MKKNEAAKAHNVSSSPVFANIYQTSTESKLESCYIVTRTSQRLRAVWLIVNEGWISSKANIFEGLKCPGLLGKPKIFFVNICRGDDNNFSNSFNNLSFVLSKLYKFLDFSALDVCLSLVEFQGRRRGEIDVVPNNLEFFVGQASISKHFIIII